MKSLTQVLIALFCVVLPATIYAQRDDSKYLAGAVPEVNGKVVFSKEFSIPGMTKDEIYQRVQNWMQDRLASNNNAESRIVYSKAEDGLIVGVGKEWIVFSSSALSLDRTEINYQLSVTSEAEKCTLKVEKIRFAYREGKEKYTAEEWITDQYALNKSKTKLVLGLAKWRRKTVDYIDNLCLSMADALSKTPSKEVAPKEKIEEKKNEKSVAASGTMVITPKKEVDVTTPVAVSTDNTIKIQVKDVAQKGALKNMPEEKNIAPSTQTVVSGATAGYKLVEPGNLSADAIRMGTGKLVIVIGKDAFNMSMMTANAGGSLGKSSGKSVVYTFLSPDQAYESIEKAENYTVRFYPNDSNEPSVILECKKMPTPAPMEGQPRMYAGEILKAWVK